MSEQDLIEKDILGFLAKHEHKELLRFVIVGSVDDGKSTLIGRLLFELHAVYEDQLEAVRKATTMVGVPIDFSLITDGLEAEREQAGGEGPQLSPRQAPPVAAQRPHHPGENWQHQRVAVGAEATRGAQQDPVARAAGIRRG